MVLMRFLGLCGYVRYDEAGAGVIIGDDIGGLGDGDGCSITCRARLTYWQPEDRLSLNEA